MFDLSADRNFPEFLGSKKKPRRKLDLVTGKFDKSRKNMVDDDGIFVVDNEESKPPVDEVDDLFGIWDLELGPDQVVSSEGNISVKSLAPFNSDWPKLLDSEDAKEDGRELLQGATSGSGVPKLSPDLGGGRRGDGGRAERVPAPSVGQNTNLKTIPRGRYGGLRSRGVSGDHGRGGNSREEILDFPLS